MKRIFLLLFPAMLIFQLHAFGQEAQEMSLQEAINYALDNNTALKIGQINIADAQEQIVERRAIGIPQLSAGVSYQYFVDIPTQILPDFISPSVYGVLFTEGVLEPGQIPETDPVAAQFGTKHNLTGSIDLNTIIFDASYFTGLQAAKTFRVYTQYEYNATSAQVRYQVKDAYMPALIIQDNIQTLEKNIKNIETLLYETQQQYKEGFVEQLDVDRLELSLANLQTEAENLERQREISINALKFVMGYPMDEELILTDDIQTLSAEVPQEQLSNPVNYQARPEYLVAQMGLQLNELNVKINKSGYLPKLSGFATHQQSLLTNDLSEGELFPTTILGLQLNIPIFDGLNKKAKVQRARLGVETSQYQIMQLERSIALEVSNARINYANAQRRLANQERNLQLAQRIYDTTKVKYKEGVGSSLEITQAEQSLFTSQQNHNQALYELLIAKNTLEKALGL